MRALGATFMCAVLGCSPASAPPAERDPTIRDPTAAAVASSPADYTSLGFPDPSNAWTRADFIATTGAWAKMIEADASVPTLDGPGDAIVRHWINRDELRSAVADSADAGQALDVTVALKTVTRGYALLSVPAEETRFGPESAELGAAMVFAMLEVAARPDMAAIMQVEVLRADDVRRGGLLQMRRGLVSMLRGGVAMAADRPQHYLASRYTEALRADWPRVLPFLTSSERATLARLATEASASEAPAGREALAAFAEAFTGDRVAPHPFVAAFREEIEAGDREEAALIASVVDRTVRATPTGPHDTDGWARYGLTGAPFTIEFPGPAVATTQQVPRPSDGATTNVVQLSYQSPAELKLTGLCMAPDAASEQDALASVRSRVQELPGASVSAVTVAGMRALHVVSGTDQSQAVMRYVQTPAGLCMAIAEFPRATAAAATPIATRFVESFAPL